MVWQNNVLQMRLHLIVSPNNSDDFNESSCVSKKKKYICLSRDRETPERKHRD